MTRLLSTRNALLAATTAALAALTGCGGSVEPGDMVVYRVAFSSPKEASSCYANGTIPPDTASDSSTLLEPGTFVLYAGTNDAIYLDAGDLVLQGTKSGNTYTFDGKSVDIEYTEPDGQGAKITKSTSTHLEMTVDSKAVTGTRSDKTSASCTGGTSNECSSFTAPTCTTTMSFVGTQVDDVQIKHSI